VLGLFILPYWIRRFGHWGTLRLTLVALLSCFLVVSPFVCWNTNEFMRVTLLSLEPFSTEEIAGRFSLRPLLASAFSQAPEVFLPVAVAAVMAVNWYRSPGSSRVAAATALGYCFVLLLMHRSFSHYYLPVIAMVLSIPYPEGTSQRSELG
jgi:hypothetical protein